MFGSPLIHRSARARRGGRFQRAVEIFEAMDGHGVPRDAITYSATISALAKGKQWQAALQVRGGSWAARRAAPRLSSV